MGSQLCGGKISRIWILEFKGIWERNWGEWIPCMLGDLRTNLRLMRKLTMTPLKWLLGIGSKVPMLFTSVS